MKTFILLILLYLTVVSGFAADGDTFQEIVVQTDGKILTAGRRLQQTATSFDFYLARLNANGSADTGFGAGGVVFTNFGTGNNDQARSILVQPDGRILVGGVSYVEAVPATTPFVFALARYQNSSLQPPVDNPALRVADFDGDGRTDPAVYRDGIFYVQTAAGGPLYRRFGTAGDVPVAAP